MWQIKLETWNFMIFNDAFFWHFGASSAPSFKLIILKSKKKKWPGYYSKQVGNKILSLLARLYSFNEQYFNWSLSDRLDCCQYRRAMSPVTRFILLLFDIMMWGCVYRCVCVCVCVCVFELVQENSFRSITSQQALAVIGVRATRLMSMAKASLSKPDSRQADQYDLCHLGASLSLFPFCLFLSFPFLL